MKTKLLILIIGLLMINGVLAWSTNTFNNSLTSENLSLIATEWQYRWLNVPTNAYLINGYMNVSGYQESLSNSSLVSYWNFNEGTGTMAKSIIAPAYYNATTTVGTVTWEDGGINTTKGTMNITQGDVTKLAFLTNSFSVCGKVKTINNTQGGIISNRKNSWWYINKLADGTIVFDIYDGANEPTVTSVSNVQSGNWVSFCVVRNKGVNLTIYINGTLDNIAVDTAGNLISAGETDALLIGSYASGDWKLGGLIDDIRIYNRSLDPYEIKGYSRGVEIGIGDSDGYFLPTGADEDLELNSSNSPNKSINLASWINSYTISCDCADCHLITGFCSVPFLFRSGYSDGILGYDNLIFNNIGFTENSQTYNASTYETRNERFIINITYDSSFYTSSSANLVYNGTSYAGTKSGSGNTIEFYKDLNIPVINPAQNRTFYWNISLTNSSGINYFISNSNNQSVNSTNFGLCNSSLVTKFLNITFMDESTSLRINGTISYSLFTYYLGDGSVNKTYTFINNTGNLEYDFCAEPNSTLKVIPTIQYSFTGYPQRVWSPAVQSYSNSTTNQILYLLGTASGQYVTFQVINTADQVLEDVELTATRLGTTVGSGMTGSTGTVQLWLNPDYEHTFTFVKSGYDTYTTSFAPTETSYTITLGGTTSSAINSTIRGIDYSIFPKNTYLINGTDYTFGFNLTSDYWDVSEYGFNLRLANGTKISGGSTSTENTYLTLTQNTGNQTIIYLDYYWIINGVYTNASRYWVIMNSEHTDWSIAHFFTDLTNYLNTDMFGIDDFGRYLIIFIIIFLTVGIVSFKYGITSPLTVSTTIFGVIFFFDVVVGLIPSIKGINHLLTYVSALILVLVIFREVQQ